MKTLSPFTSTSLRFSMINVKTGVALLAALAVSGCDSVTPPQPNRQSIAGVTCPGGQIAYDFGEFANGNTSESLAQLGGVLDGGSLVSRNVIQVDSAQCANLSGALVDVTAGMRWETFNKSTFADVGRNYGNPECLGLKKVKYHCSLDPTQTFDVAWNRRTGPLGFFCVNDPKRLPIACVPENCYGRTRRDRQLQCVPDLVKPTESKDDLKLKVTTFTRIFDSGSTASQFGEADGKLLAKISGDVLYRVKGTVSVPGTVAPQRVLTLWLESKVPKDGKLVPEVNGFRCALNQVDLSKYTPRVVNGVQFVDFDEKMMVPSTCADGPALRAVTRTILKANNVSTAFLEPGGTVPEGMAIPTETRLMASYDLDNTRILTSKATALESTCAVNPIDFFFNYDTRVHNARDYYLQTSIPVSWEQDGKPVNGVDVRFGVAQETIGVSEASVQGLLYRLNKAGGPSGRIDVNFKLFMSGSDSEWVRTVAISRLSLDSFTHANSSTKNVLTGLFPVKDTMVKDAEGNILVDKADFVPLPKKALEVIAGTRLDETGSSFALTVPITSALRTAILSHAKYPIAIGQTQNYILQVCATPYTFTYSSNDANATVQAVTAPGAKGSLLPSFNHQCARSGVFSFFAENIFTPIPEVELSDGDVTELAPTTNGDSDLAATLDNDTDRQCVGLRCQTTVSQGLQGSDNPAKSDVFSVDSTEDESDGNLKLKSELHLLGFDVLNTMDSRNYASDAPTSITLNIAPGWEGIATALKRTIPGSRIESKDVTQGVTGLSIGIEIKVPLHFGPVQGDLVFGLGAGAGIGLELQYEYNPRVAATCQNGTSTCAGSTVALTPLTFRAARDKCYELGGILMEPRTDAEDTLFRASIPGAEEAWVGAQVGNEYKDNTTCATTWNTSQCATGHVTYLRWLSDATNFRSSTSFGPFAYLGAPRTLNGRTLSAATKPAGAPVESGVTLLNDAFSVKPMSETHRSVCYRNRTVSGKSYKVSATLNLGLSGGFSVAFCTPSADLGVCLEGAINLVEVKLSPSVAYTHTVLTDNTNRSGVQSKIDLEIGWEVTLLSGDVQVKFVSPFFSAGYTLAEYGGFNVASGTLLEKEFPLRSDFQ